ncbi:hypothetical protein BDN67DRAFT_978186 [Paxillus ammoniavirescens]|nr:hypothetical protein BDN67DRAFT_978186 [Paxillus ammoniavirescens]
MLSLSTSPLRIHGKRHKYSHSRVRHFGPQQNWKHLVLLLQLSTCITEFEILVIPLMQYLKKEIPNSTVMKYFVQDARFSHPMCRANSRNEILGLSQWYGVASPKAHRGTELYDSDMNVLVVEVEVVVFGLSQANLEVMMIVRLELRKINGLRYITLDRDLTHPIMISARGLYGEFEVGMMQHWAGWAGELKGGAISFGGLSWTEWTNVGMVGNLLLPDTS